MTDYTELIRQLKTYEDGYGLYDAAAEAIKSLNRLLDQNTQRCEALRKQLREAHESYEKHLNELEAQLPKRGEWINSKERMRPEMCSVCGCVYEADRFIDKIVWNYCPNCGAKMTEVQDGQK